MKKGTELLQSFFMNVSGATSRLASLWESSSSSESFTPFSRAGVLRSTMLLLFLISLNAAAFMVHIKSPFSGDELHIFGGENNQWGIDKMSGTPLVDKGDGWFSLKISDKEEDESTTLSENSSPSAKTVILGSMKDLLTGSKSYETQVWVEMDNSGIVSKTFIDPKLGYDSNDVIERPAHWNDSVRVFFIWNRGTAETWVDATPDFVLDALAPIDNIVIRSGNDSDWEDIATDNTLSALRTKFGGKLPHVIVDINNGHAWDGVLPITEPKSTSPYELLQVASDSGIGVVTIGDNSAFVGQHSFPLTGQDGTGKPENQDLDGMRGGEHLVDSLWIWLDPEEDSYLPDGGLMWNVADDTLHFYDYGEGRNRQDADLWSIDKSWLDNYSFVGFQRGWSEPTGFVHSEPDYYKTIAALQRTNQRIVMLCIQPQDISNRKSMFQITYNSVYWASKAHETLKLPTPEADPEPENYSVGDDITLSVALPNASLYELFYTIDGSDPTKSSIPYTGPITTTGMTKNLTLKAKAFATNTKDWIDSDIMIEHYILDSAILNSNHPDGTKYTDELAVFLTTNGDKIYYTLDGSKPDTTDDSQLFSDTIKITAGMVTVNAIAVGDTVLWASDSWTYSQYDDAFLNSNHPDGTKYTDELAVFLTTNGDKIYYTLDGSEPDTTDDSQLFSDTIKITSGTVTVNAIAVGDTVLPVTDSWTYSQYDDAYLNSNHPNGTKYIEELAVFLTTNGDKIYYTLDGSEPDTTDDSQLFSDTIKITSGTVTVKATAVGDTVLSISKSWTYIQELPQLYVEASPGGITSGTISFYFDTTITFRALDSAGETVEDADIYYLIDDGDGPLITVKSGTLFKDDVKIDSTVRIQAIAVAKYYLDGTGEWQCTMKSAQNSITVQSFCHSHIDSTLVEGEEASGSSDTLPFGSHLKLVFDSDCEDIEYAIEGADFQQYSKGDTVTIPEDSPDTVEIALRSEAHGYESAEMALLLLRDTIDGLVVTPEEEGFLSDKITATASLEGEWVNSAIFVDTGNTPVAYTKPISITERQTVTFEARADFAIKQRITKSYYPIASVDSAWYIDSDGDGAIDSLSIQTNRDTLDSTPDSLEVRSPFSDEKRVVYAADMKASEGRLSVSFPAFSYDGMTGFDKAQLGTLYGKEYTSEAVVISDGVAPVLTSAKYCPGEIVEMEPAVIRAVDTLILTYSEVVSLGDSLQPTAFVGHTEADEFDIIDASFQTRSEQLSNSQYSYTEALFTVDTGAIIPSTGDSVNIALESFTVDSVETEQRIEENRAVELYVKPVPYALLIKALSPVDPQKDAIPTGLTPSEYPLQTGVVVTIDFLIPMVPENQDVAVTILDAVGNKIIAMNGIDDNSENLFVQRETEKSTILTLYWSGKNTQGRFVGSGAYKAMLRIDDGQGERIDRSIMLGISNSN